MFPDTLIMSLLNLSLFYLKILLFFGAPNYGPEIDNNGNTIAIVFSNSANETNNLYFIYSLDAGVTFSNPIKIIEEDAFIEGAGVHINSNNIPIVTYENLQSNGIANQLLDLVNLLTIVQVLYLMILLLQMLQQKVFLVSVALEI